MKKGFTLIELIVVIAIIAILAAIIAPNAFKAIEKARISKLVADFKAIKTAGQTYYLDIMATPPDLCPEVDPGFVSWDAYQADCCPLAPMNPGRPAGWETNIENNWDGPYLEVFPQKHAWGGSYDFEGRIDKFSFTARPKFDQGTCNYPGGGGVPADTEVKLQQEGIDVSYTDVNTPSGNVTMRWVEVE